MKTIINISLDPEKASIIKHMQDQERDPNTSHFMTLLLDYGINVSKKIKKEELKQEDAENKVKDEYKNTLDNIQIVCSSDHNLDLALSEMRPEALKALNDYIMGFIERQVIKEKLI